MQAKVEAKVKAKVEAKVEAKVVAKVEAKVEAKVKAKVKAKVEVKVKSKASGGVPTRGVQPQKFCEKKNLRAEGPQIFFRVRLGRTGATVEQVRRSNTNIRIFWFVLLVAAINP